ncbi:MAG: MFS transporter [Planctomycetaceae bacterium]|nr:MFS transporter [Planctomycetaceae bacterium]
MSESGEFAVAGLREPAEAGFGRPFWCSYCANALMMTAVSLLFVYADFVRSLGGDEEQLGRIVGVGMIGGIVMRFAQGVGIDRFGPRSIWLTSTAIYVGSCLMHLTITRVDTPAVYLLRIVYQSSLAGFFGASIAYVAGRAPVARMAEVIGTLGTSGFVGMMLGTTLGRYIIGDGTGGRARIDALFLSSATCASLAFAFSVAATRGHVHPRLSRRGPPLWWLIRRYNPGLVLIMSVATGMGLNLPTVFLRPYMADLMLAGGVMFFFNLYPPIAFATRLTMRRVPDLWGIKPMIALGLVGLVIGILLFLPVRTTTDLIWPAIFLGVAHASLFPAVVAGGTGTFPGRWRGTGTTYVLAMFDIGTFIGSPLTGELIAYAERHDLPKWPLTFSTIAGLLTLCGLIYFGFSRKTPKRRGS